MVDQVTCAFLSRVSWLAASREFHVTAQQGFESHASTPGLTIFDLGSSKAVPPFAPPAPSTDATKGTQVERLLEFATIGYVEAILREWTPLVKSTVVTLSHWSVRFQLGVGALWLSSIVAAMWAAVLFQSIWLNIVNIKCAILIRVHATWIVKILERISH